MHRGKKYQKASQLIDHEMLYDVNEAVELLEKTNTVKFDPTIEIHFTLGLDPKHADQTLRSTLTLPHGTGKTVRIAAFTDAQDISSLTTAGATLAGGDNLIEKVSKGDIHFDVAIATPTMMRKMGKIAKILGPKGLMPNPKTGTVGENLESIIQELQAGRFEFRNDKQGNVHSILGKLSFGSQKLRDNLMFFYKTIKDARPTGLKGSTKYIQNVSICNTMGPGIRLDISSLDA